MSLFQFLPPVCHKHFKNIQSVPNVSTRSNPDVDDGLITSDDDEPIYDLQMFKEYFVNFQKYKAVYV